MTNENCFVRKSNNAEIVSLLRCTVNRHFKYTFNVPNEETETTAISKEFRQEKAKFVYSNPNYVKDAHVFTGRRNRNDSYYTNLTITTLMATGNNVSASITLQMMSGGDFRVSQKLCDIMKEAWIVNFMRAHSDIDSTCPFPPGTYHIFNMVLPPKNMPIPMVASDYYIILEMYLTKTKEQIAKLTSSLRYVETKWKKP
ncbi:uncharacterized protein LOC120632910 [Pararge aegeria]|uniref:uncharacterized protein LOC120632910 n=1 Tax=Pararge aegeria TaxID=116150 RepID=UPI0019CFD1D1|nr:uncharacterized protein LOC120632910 [Pararge aegeria]